MFSLSSSDVEYNGESYYIDHVVELVEDDNTDKFPLETLAEFHVTEYLQNYTSQMQRTPVWYTENINWRRSSFDHFKENEYASHNVTKEQIEDFITNL